VIDLRPSDDQRARLPALAVRVGDVQLRRTVRAGRTASALLAHIAFWDRRATALLEAWARGARRAAGDDVDAVNRAARHRWLLVPPRAAVDEAIAAAEAHDRRLRAASPEPVRAAVDAGGTVALDRAAHRRDHLDEIERALARGASPADR
jgi:hypothetical protein